MHYVWTSAFFSVLILSTPACKKKAKPQESPKTADSTAVSTVLPSDASLSALSVRYGSFFEGVHTYSFSPKTFILKGTWIRGDAHQQPGRAEGQTSVGEFEWALVYDNLRVLKPLAIDASTCGRTPNGQERLLTLEFLSKGEAKTVTVGSESSLAVRCADHYMPDKSFQSILAGLQKKLPQPTDAQSYKPLQP